MSTACRYPGFLVLLILLLLPGFSAYAGKKFDFNNRCQQAYQAILHLKIQEGERLIAEEKRTAPDNLIPLLLDNYIDFLQLFFNEDPALFKSKRALYARRLEWMDKGPQNSPYFLFSKAVIHFQWAAILVKFGYNWEAGWAFRRSFLQARENRRAFPAFGPSQLYLGAMQVAAGTIPDGYKWLSNLLGIRGSIQEGMRSLTECMNRPDAISRIFREEAIFYYLYLKFYVENDRAGVFDFIEREQLDLVNNHLFAYLASNLSINSQQAARGLRIIRQRNPSPDYLQTPVWDLEAGYAQLQHLEPGANLHLESFVKNFRGSFYLKDALQKLSWYYYLQGNQPRADYYRAMVRRSGATDSEADRQAQHEAESGRWPNRLLLKVRLLNDGGYHREALGLLQGFTIQHFGLPAERLEFAYRVGRIYDDLGMEEAALRFYGEAVRLGDSRKEYYAARAALQTAYIHEKRKDCAAAAYWYRRCLAMKESEFKNSLDQRAKAGLLRCGGG